MLVPLTRQSIEQIVPIIATGPQYAHYWGKWSDFLRRLFISVIALTAAWLIGNFGNDLVVEVCKKSVFKPLA